MSSKRHLKKRVPQKRGPPIPIPNRQLLLMKAAAAFVSMPTSTFYALSKRKDGDLPSGRQIAPGSRLYWHARDLEEWLDSKRQRTDVAVPA